MYVHNVLASLLLWDHFMTNLPVNVSIYINVCYKVYFSDTTCYSSCRMFVIIQYFCPVGNFCIASNQRHRSEVLSVVLCCSITEVLLKGTMPFHNSIREQTSSELSRYFPGHVALNLSL